jgi:hypothetical protein
MWPAALIVGMFALVGALGTATAPTAQALPTDMCDILGPFPDVSGGVDAGLENNLLVEGNTYLFIISVEDDTFPFVSAFIDDETGNANITAYATYAADTPNVGDTIGWNDTPGNGVDDLVAVPNAPVATWDAADAGFVDDAADEFAVDIYSEISDNGCGTGTATAGLLPENNCNGVNDDPADDAVIDDGADCNDGLTFLQITCLRDGTFELTAFQPAINANSITEAYECVNYPTQITLTATPTSVESAPAIGNVHDSLIVATVSDSAGHYVSEGYVVDWSATGCKIEARDQDEYTGSDGDAALFAAFKSSVPATAAAINDHASGATTAGSDTSSDTFLYDASPAPGLQLETRAAAILHCEGADPGIVTVTATIDDHQDIGNVELGPSSDISGSVDVTVVGPPAFITMVAEPTELVCGEKAQILVTVTDALNQNVSDHTFVELVTNYGGVLGGTGSSLTTFQPVNPLSSSEGETFGGVATAYLLTSTGHIGAYEVVAAAGGSHIGAYEVDYSFGDGGTFVGNTGVFSTPVVTSQVTVTCTEAAPPEVTAPDTGTGNISPPNTGDAGLAASSSSTAMLFVIAGAVAFVLAGVAKFGFARR